MSKFAFRLQPLLNIKEQKEDNLKNELGKAVRAYEDEKRLLEEIHQEISQKVDEVCNNFSKGISAGKMKEYNLYLSILKKNSEMQKEIVNNAGIVVDKCREELLKASQERQMFEKLREKKKIEFLIEDNIQQQKLVDERISYNFGNTT